MKVHDQQVVGEGSGTSRDHARAASGASLPAHTWLREGCTVYALMQDGWDYGKPQMVNRWSFHVQGSGRHGATPEEQEAVAILARAAPDLLDGCNALLGLVQLVLARDDVPIALRHVLIENHRLGEARAAIAKALGQ